MYNPYNENENQKNKRTKNRITPSLKEDGAQK